MPDRNTIDSLFCIEELTSAEEHYRRNRKYSEEETENSKSWMICLNRNQEPENWSKIKEKTLPLAYKFIPSELRNQLWPALFENKLVLSNRLFIELVGKWERGWLIKQNESQMARGIRRSVHGKPEEETGNGYGWGTK